MFDLSDVGFVKRITLGSKHPEALQTDDQLDAANDLLNRCLTDYPRGRLIGIEKSFRLLSYGENIVVLQWTCYHVGFPRKPTWIA